MKFEEIQWSHGDRIQDSQGNWWSFVRDNVGAVYPLIFAKVGGRLYAFSRKGWWFCGQEMQAPSRRLMAETYQPQQNKENSMVKKLSECITPEDVKNYFTCDAKNWDVWGYKDDNWYGYIQGIGLVKWKDEECYLCGCNEPIPQYNLQPRYSETFVEKYNWILLDCRTVCIQIVGVRIEDGELQGFQAGAWWNLSNAYKWIGHGLPNLGSTPETHPYSWARITRPKLIGAGKEEK